MVRINIYTEVPLCLLEAFVRERERVCVCVNGGKLVSFMKA